MKKDPLPLLDTCSKSINIGTPNTTQDVSEVHLEAENDYILPINFEAVLKESLYSDTVYTAEGITSEGILTDSFSELELDSTGWSTTYKFIYKTDCSLERKSDFL